MRPLRGTDVKRLNREWRRRTTGRVALLLEGVQNPFNVGSILRTAAALRVDHVWFTGGATTPAHPKVGKTALGSERFVNWSEHRSLAAAATGLRDEGYRLVGVELAGGATPVHEAHLTDAVCFALGHEERGLSPACLEACDTVAFIPQLGRIGSLNVAQAAAIVLWEARRREWAGTGSPGG